MPKRKPTAGAQYTYNGAAVIGADGPVPGDAVTVRELVSAGTAGAHDDSEDAVVIEWQVDDIVVTPDGVTRDKVTRAMSISAESFGSDFKEV